MAEILPTHTAALFNAAVKRAAELLRAGEIVVLPTETVYGLAANALDATAVEKIYETKGRPKHNPIIVHVANLKMAKDCTSTWPETATKLAKSFWPGPLTVVLPRSKKVPDVVTAGGDTVGIRWPSHPFIQAVIRECGFPLAAPSANLANEISPTNAEHVRKSLGEKVQLIIDGGQSQVGIESTVVDLTATPPQVLRPGMIHEESLAAALELPIAPASRDRLPIGSGSLKSPGLLKKHYAPKAKLVILNWQSEKELKLLTSHFSLLTSQVHIIAHTNIPSGENFGRVSVIPHDAEAFARAIYAELHRCDEEGAKLIVVESLPAGFEWRGIADRLTRAAS